MGKLQMYLFYHSGYINMSSITGQFKLVLVSDQQGNKRRDARLWGKENCIINIYLQKIAKRIIKKTIRTREFNKVYGHKTFLQRNSIVFIYSSNKQLGNIQAK